MWNTILDKIGDWVAYFCMPLVTCYHLVSGNIFLNTVADDATGLEYAGNVALAPFQYLFAGETAFAHEDYEFRQTFDYSHYLAIKATASVVALPLSFFIGSTLKGASYLSPTVRKRHALLSEARHSKKTCTSFEVYEALGLKVRELVHDKIASLECSRGPGEEQHLAESKEALREICKLLTEHGIAFWGDCGTCLGAYRYGGVIPWDADIDIAVLQLDFRKVKRVLSHLDKEKYLVQDWSNRLHPETYLKVYIRKTRDYIDIYHFGIDPQQKTLHYILSNAESMFMPDSWKIREKRYTVPTPYDVVFPLKYANFDGIEIPVPHDTQTYLQLRYGENLNPVKVYDPVTKEYIKDLSHPYWQEAYVH